MKKMMSLFVASLCMATSVYAADSGEKRGDGSERQKRIEAALVALKAVANDTLADERGFERKLRDYELEYSDLCDDDELLRKLFECDMVFVL